MTKIAGPGSGSISQRHGSADPDPLQNVMDPQHWDKLSRSSCLARGLSLTQPFLNESTAMRGRSSLDLPRWWRGWANFTPSAVRKFTCCRSDSSSRFTRSLYSCNTTMSKFKINTIYFRFNIILLKDEMICTRERLQHDWFIPKEVWRIFDSKALVDFFHI
jgi:hypothetical protein